MFNRWTVPIGIWISICKLPGLYQTGITGNVSERVSVGETAGNGKRGRQNRYLADAGAF